MVLVIPTEKKTKTKNITAVFFWEGGGFRWSVHGSVLSLEINAAGLKAVCDAEYGSFECVSELFLDQR